MEERNYTIPLRRQWRKTVRYRRAKKTIKAIREFLQKHMKSETVKIGRQLNEAVWKHGIQNPPSKIKVSAVKDKAGTIMAELFGAKEQKETVVAKKATAKKLKDKISEKKQ